MVDPETLDLLEQQFSEDIITKLIIHAHYMAEEYRWVRGTEALPGGGNPEDVAFEAIEKLHNGTHHWNQEKHPDLLDHLKSRVDSILYTRVYLKEHRLSTRDVDDMALDVPSPAVIGIDKKEEEERARQATRALEQAADEPLLKDVLAAHFAGFKPREVAELLDLESNEVYVLTRKLLRRARSILGIPTKR